MVLFNSEIVHVMILFVVIEDVPNVASSSEKLKSDVPLLFASAAVLMSWISVISADVLRVRVSDAVVKSLTSILLDVYSSEKRSGFDAEDKL